MPTTGPDETLAASTTGDREQVLYDSERTRISRVWPAGRAESIIRKEPRGPGSERRLRHELAILDRLAGVDGVPQRAPGVDMPGAIVLVDDGGTAVAAANAAGLVEPLDATELLDFALQLAGIVATMHGRGVVHKDINPANILTHDAPRRLTLIDFDIATTSAEELPGFVHHNAIAGTLPYIAPEQTGRTGWAVDARADLYALGATLYELATGAPPFGFGDPLQLARDHLARMPVPATERNAAVPLGLSEIIGRLLEKEPDQRYQSAEGLAHDLTRLREQWAGGHDGTFRLGERDFPLRLSPPSRPVGREAERAALRDAFEDAVTGRVRGVLVSGGSGVGKTALVGELRPVVTASGGWFLAGKFDQHRQDLDADAVAQVMRGLARLALAEPEEDVAALRAELLDRLGPNTSLAAAMAPEWAILLDVPAEVSAGDPREAEQRLFRAGLDLLRAVATRRPVVLVIDDLQWAPATPIGFIDAVLSDDSLGGVLVVGAYRDAEVDGAHPLAATLSRWERLPEPPQRLWLENLPTPALSELLAAMLRLGPERAAELAGVVAERTGGNPYDTVELINALRRDEALVAGADGWQWDKTRIGTFIGDGDVAGLIEERIDRLPAPAAAVLEIMAALGGEVGLDLLTTASGMFITMLEERLTPALEDGLLVMRQDGEATAGFRHDRVQQVAYERVAPEECAALHLTLARRLVAYPRFAHIAADQYLAAVDGLSDPSECRRLVDLFREAATASRMVNVARSERYLRAAIALLDTVRTPADDPLRIALHTELHTALYALGCLADADEVYALIGELCPDPLDRTDAATVQIGSLTIRHRSPEALALGLDLLGQLGLAVPGLDDIGPQIVAGLEALRRWVDDPGRTDDLARPEVTDPRVVAVGRLIDHTTTAAFFVDQAMMTWLMLQAHRLLVEHGLCAPLVAPLGCAAFVTAALGEDYRTGYATVRHVLELSEARGYDLETARVRFLYSLSAVHWFEPVENAMAHARRAYEDQLRLGDPHNASFSLGAVIPLLLDCAPTLERLLGEVEVAFVLAGRVGNQQSVVMLLLYRQLVRALRGETDSPGGLSDSSFDDAAHLAAAGPDSIGAAYVHVIRAFVAAILGNHQELDVQSTKAAALMPMLTGVYSLAMARVLRALALAGRIRAAAPEDRDAVLAELDQHRDWLAARAADAPTNFGHLARLVEAERAHALGDVQRALAAFDAALQAVPSSERPWHRALITEGAARCHLGHGLEHTGRRLLAEARRCYADWGATAKVRDLDRDHPYVSAPTGLGLTPSVRTITDERRTGNVSSDAIDLLAVLDAAQALSSETNLDRLVDRVADVLGAMTGATSVRLVLRDDDTQTWWVPAAAAGTGTPVDLEEAAERGLLPLTAFRYAERTREPLLVNDAGTDHRFSSDPYLAGVPTCSLLVVPILARGAPRAVLMLENRLSRGAFSPGRLDAATLVAGQLAVCIDNALVYTALERKVAERTQELAAANARLEALSVTDPLTGLANRRRLTAILDAEWRRALRPKSWLAVAMIDIDHFKPYNDHYGHPAGDVCLRRVAAALNECVRETDLIARYGGEEFAVILPGADAAAARLVGERMRATVVGLNEPHAKAPRGRVTVSVGITAVVPSVHDTGDSLISAADQHLYEAKRAGRNRVAGEQTVF